MVNVFFRKVTNHMWYSMLSEEYPPPSDAKYTRKYYTQKLDSGRWTILKA